MNLIDTIFHFTNYHTLEKIIAEGFKPSFANEKLGKTNILIPMVSFCNILLRDIGKDQVLNYGEFGIGFSRTWAIKNNINPVIYSYDNGQTANAIKDYLDNSVFISGVNHFKEHFRQLSECKCGPFSKSIKLTNTSKEALDLIDYLSYNYNDELTDIISAYALANYEKTKALIYLTKPYEVENMAGQKFIAYNDREWRKAYCEINFIIEGEELYQETKDSAKPHLTEDKYRLKFDLNDLITIVIESEDNINQVKKALYQKFGEEEVENRISSNKLKINTREALINLGY